MLFLVLAACRPDPLDGGLDGLRAEVLASLAEDVAGRHYTDLAARAAVLESEARSLCSGPTAAALATTRDAWWSLREPWKRTEIIAFGPSVEYPHRLGPPLDDGPVDAEAVGALLASDAPLGVDDFDAMGSVTRGMPVVELLLWTGDEPLVALSSDARRCRAVVGASGDVARNAERLRVAWVDDWADRLARPAAIEGDIYATPQDALDEWVNRMAFTVENVRVVKLGAPVGDGSGGEVRPELLESSPSGRSLWDARDALQGVVDVWTGDVDGDHPGVRDLVAGSALADDVDRGLDLAVAALADIPEPLSQTIGDDPAAVATAQGPLRALQVLLQVDLAQALGVTVTFNDNDGD